MKKKVCLAMSLLMLAGTVPAQAETIGEAEQITFTAKVGTKELYRNQSRISLDAAIYIKDGYVMLPLRTFMKALYADAELVWEDGIQLAKVTMQDYTLSFDITGNRIWRNSSLLPSFGQMEVKDGRVFVPLRDWEGVLQGNSRYIVDADALRWDAETKTAAVQLTELTAATENDTSSIKGTGEAAVFGIPLTDRYDYIESIGGDYFIARKYLNQDSGKPNEDGNWDTDWFVLDHQGKVLHEYDNKDVSYLRGYGDGFLRLNKRDGTSQILDMEGNTQFADDYHVIDSFSEGLAMVMDYKEGKSGYINAKGEEVISLSSYSADAFSEGLAAVGVDLPKEEGMQSAETRYGYIDKKGGWVIEPKYRDAFAFRDGLAKVEDTDRNIGYIDKTGKEVIPLRYNKITDFWNGKAFAQEKDYKIDGIGIGTPGIVDGTNRIVLGGAENINGWENIHLADRIETETGLPALLGNDANLMGLGETMYGAGQGATHVVFLTVGTGIGGAVVIDGKLFNGYANRGTELGHVPLIANGEPCACGSVGCLEHYASTSALVRRFSQRIIDAGISYPNEEINGELIVRLYKQGDPIAKISLEEHCDFLGHGIAGFINIFSPQKIVIGGGLSEAGDFYIQKVSEKARSYAIPDCAVNTQIIAAALGNKAGSIGAASLVFTQLSAPNLIKL